MQTNKRTNNKPTKNKPTNKQTIATITNDWQEQLVSYLFPNHPGSFCERPFPFIPRSFSRIKERPHAGCTSLMRGSQSEAKSNRTKIDFCLQLYFDFVGEYGSGSYPVKPRIMSRLFSRCTWGKKNVTSHRTHCSRVPRRPAQSDGVHHHVHAA